MSGKSAAIAQAAIGVIIIAGAVILAPFTGGVSLTAVMMGVGMLAGAAAMALAPMPSLGQAKGQGGPQSGVSSSVPGERFCYGRISMPGVPIYLTGSIDRRSNASDRDFAHVLYIFNRGRRFDGLEGIWFKGEFVELVPNEGQEITDYWPENFLVPPRGAKYHDLIGVHFEPGDGSEGPWQYIMNHRSNDEWTTDHKLTGITWAGVTFRHDDERLPGLPDTGQFLFQFRGFRVFDPISGEVSWTRNSARIWNDALTSVYGPRGGVSANLIDQGYLAAATNICAEQVQLLTEPGEPAKYADRYICDGWWEATEDFDLIEEAILASMAGTRVKMGESWLIFAGAHQAPSMDLGVDDLAGPIEYVNRYRPYDAISNEAHAIFLNKEKGYVEDQTVPYAPPAYRTQDKGAVLVHEMEMRAVVNAEQVQRLQKIWLEQHRRQITWKATFKPRAMILRPWSVVRYTDPMLGWTNKTFQIASWEFDGLNVTMEFTEYDAGIYSWVKEDFKKEAGTGGIVAPLAAVRPVLLDIPVFRDRDARDDRKYGFYAAVRPTGTTGRATAARVWRSTEQAGEYLPIADVPRHAIAGTTETALQRIAESAAAVPDNASFVDVLLDRDYVLSSANDFALGNMANLCSIGDPANTYRSEMLQFGLAVKLGTRRWRLSRLRRALFGTGEYLGTHAAGDLFVLMGPEVVRISDPRSLFNEQRWYKADVDGSDPFDAAAYAFTNRGQGVRPIPPVDFRIGINANGDLKLRWFGRARGFVGWVDGNAISDEEQRWQIDILRPGTSNVARSYYIYGFPQFFYAKADQIADLGAPVTQRLGVGIRHIDREYGSGDRYTYLGLPIGETF